VIKLSSFKGFPNAALKFLKDIEKNNKRPWFEKNRDVYVEKLQQPSIDFAEALQSKLKKINKNIEFSPKTVGGSVKKIHRDIRFSKDKTIFKNWQDIVLWEGPSKNEAYSRIYTRIQPGNSGIGLGSYAFDKDMMAAYRAAVDNGRSGKELERIVADLSKKKYEIYGEQLKSAPRGFDADHDRIELLRYKGLFFHSPKLTAKDITSPKFVDICYKHCQNMMPFHKWLVKVAKKA
jgi:uncharacterized protein (TIGR02453 family)